jgi:hypothetical protein
LLFGAMLSGSTVSLRMLGLAAYLFPNLSRWIYSPYWFGSSQLLSIPLRFPELSLAAGALIP